MRSALWLRPIFRNKLLLTGLLFMVLFRVASAAQENTPPHVSKPDETLTVVTAPFSGRTITAITVNSYIEQTVFLSIFPMTKQGAQAVVLLAPFEPGPGCLPAYANFLLPPGAYKIGVAFGGKTHQVEVQGSSAYGYTATVGSAPSVCATSAPSRGEVKGLDPSVGNSGTTTIQQQIDRIVAGAHQQLPQPVQTQLAPGQNPGWSIENATGYQLHLYLSGPVERDYVIPNGNSIAIDLPAGSYRIAAEVSASNVLPFFAIRHLDSGARWTSHFYISSH